MKKSADLFISYRRNDSPDATGRIYDYLKKTYGRKKIFIDIESIPLGVNFERHIEEKIKTCKVFIPIIGKNWNKTSQSDYKSKLDIPNDYVRIEILLALKFKIPILPLFVNDADMPFPEELPLELTDFVKMNGIKIRANLDFDKDITSLIERLLTEYNIKKKECHYFWKQVYT